MLFGDVCVQAQRAFVHIIDYYYMFYGHKAIEEAQLTPDLIAHLLPLTLFWKKRLKSLAHIHDFV